MCTEGPQLMFFYALIFPLHHISHCSFGKTYVNVFVNVQCGAALREWYGTAAAGQ